MVAVDRQRSTVAATRRRWVAGGTVSGRSVVAYAAGNAAERTVVVAGRRRMHGNAAHDRGPGIDADTTSVGQNRILEAALADSVAAKLSGVAGIARAAVIRVRLWIEARAAAANRSRGTAGAGATVAASRGAAGAVGAGAVAAGSTTPCLSS